jgi:hypothetical protein
VRIRLSGTATWSTSPSAGGGEVSEPDAIHRKWPDGSTGIVSKSAPPCSSRVATTRHHGRRRQITFKDRSRSDDMDTPQHTPRPGLTSERSQVQILLRPPL